MGNRLTAKLGPLPVWAWGVVIGSLLVMVVYVRRTDNGTTDVGDSTSSGNDSRAAILTGYDGSGIPISSLPGGTQATDQESAQATNEMWLYEAVKTALAAGYAPLVAERALRKYLSGDKLSTDDQAIINKVLGKNGLPPDGVAGTPDLAPDTVTPTPAAKNYATVTRLTAPSTGKLGKAFNVSATVTPVDSKSGRPTGKVQFIVNGKVMSTRTVYQSGTVESALRISKTPHESVQILANYVPTGNWKGSKDADTILLKK